jgi:hypothetical protein
MLLVEMNLHLYSVEHSGDEILFLLSMFVDVICPTNKLAVDIVQFLSSPALLDIRACSHLYFGQG